MITSLKRVIRLGLNGFKRQLGLSIATVFIISLTVLTITFLFISYQFSNLLISILKEKVDVSVYFTEPVTDEEITKIRDEISKLPEVKEVEFIPHEEAVQGLISKHPELADSIRETEGFLNIASLNIKVFDPEEYQAVINFIENSDFSKKIEVDYYQRKPIIDRISSFNKVLNRGGTVMFLILGFIAFAVAFTQIKLAILYSKEEIGIQRLVGASNWFIRGPFLMQGITVGIVAVIISFIISLMFFVIVSPKAETFFPGAHLISYFLDNSFKILLIQSVAGVGIGVVSSFFAVRKYLNI